MKRNWGVRRNWGWIAGGVALVTAGALGTESPLSWMTWVVLAPIGLVFIGVGIWRAMPWLGGVHGR